MNRVPLVTLILASLGVAWPLSAAIEPGGRSGGASQELSLRLDVRNLLSPSRKEALSKARVRVLISQVNAVYSQCNVKFVPRVIESIPAAELKVAFPPQSESDMEAIGDKLNPHGFSKVSDAFPLTIAGNFRFFAPAYGLYLHGLTWSWVKGPNHVHQLHSVIGRQHLDAPRAVSLISHELGHFFWLKHQDGDNIMGSGLRILPEQCEKIRTVASTYFPAMVAKSL